MISQESLASEVDETVRGLANFAENELFDQVAPSRRSLYAPSYPEHAVPILRWINRFQKSVLRAEDGMSVEPTPSSLYRVAGSAMRRWPITTLLGGYRPVANFVEKKFRHRFDDSNRELLSMINQDLRWRELEVPEKHGGRQLKNQIVFHVPMETAEARVVARNVAAAAGHPTSTDTAVSS